MPNKFDVLVTLSTFGEHSDEPRTLLDQSGFSYKINITGRRMTPEEVVEMGRNCQGLVAGLEQYTKETFAKLTHLHCISRCGTGIDNIDLSEAKRRKIAVLTTPDAPTDAVAEYTLTMILALLRRLPQVDSFMHKCRWQRIPGNLLAGKTVGIIGLGRIGKRVSQLMQAFGATVIVAEPYPDWNWAHEHEVELIDLQKLLPRADIVSIHASTSDDQPLCMGASEFSLMKRGAWLINMARGDMIDDEELSKALASGHLSGAGLDVFSVEPYDGPLCNSDRVILSPHQATLTVETRTAMEKQAVENLVRYLQAKKSNS